MTRSIAKPKRNRHLRGNCATASQGHERQKIKILEGNKGEERVLPDQAAFRTTWLLGLRSDDRFIIILDEVSFSLAQPPPAERVLSRAVVIHWS